MHRVGGSLFTNYNTKLNLLTFYSLYEFSDRINTHQSPKNIKEEFLNITKNCMQ